MKKYKLIVMSDGEQLTGEYENVVKGFVAAETIAHELLKEYIYDYPDAYVALFEKNEDVGYYDYLIYTADCFGDMYWKMMVMGDYCPLYDRLLEDYEKEELEELRKERERHVYELSEEELKQLRTEVRLGSMYLSDFTNSLNIDEDEVFDVCEAYEYYLRTDDDGTELPQSEWGEDTPEMFAAYCMNTI